MSFRNYIEPGFSLPLLAFIFSFVYPLVKWGFPWRISFLIGVMGCTCELFIHRAFTGSY